MLPDQLFYNTGIFTYIWLLRNEKPASHRGRVLLIDARQQFEKEPKAFASKRNRMTNAHREWIEQRYRDGWAKGYADEQVKIFRREDFAYHKVGVVFWQTDEHDKPAIVTEPYEKAFTAANVTKELEFHASELTFRVRVKTAEKVGRVVPNAPSGSAKTVEFVLRPADNATKKFKAAFGDRPEILSVEWTHRQYVQDDEYIPYGEDIEAFLKREIAKPIIRWEDSPQLGYEILPNKYFYRYQPHARKGIAGRILEAGEGGGENVRGIGAMKTATDSTVMTSPEYRRFIEDLKVRVISARISAARAVNGDLILLYWDIGRGIVERQQTLGWGESVVELVARDLQAAFPGTTGFSAQNVWRMPQFYRTHTAPEFLSQLVRELEKEQRAVPDPANLSQLVREMVATVPWGHHANILAKLIDPAARLYYLRATARFGWSRNVLLNQIKAGAYERAVIEKKTNNFPLALPEHLAEQADEMLKSSYNLEFLGLRRAVKERELEDRLITRLQAFLLELGYGFCFVGRQHRLTLGQKEYFIDLLFYHRFLRALVAFELKVGPFEPEFAGKMDFYLNLLNDKERAPEDRPSIGIILCAEKDDVEVEYALRTKANPIGVAVYQLQSKLPADLKGKLPTAKQLADVVRAVIPERSAP
jgi:predicted nuclease of restriction endonuclease-like (RecB) superfamily